MKKIFLLFFIPLFSLQCKAPQESVVQKNTAEISEAKLELHAKPKLVVGIVVDQMRYDYLTRFWDHYTTNGFKRLIGEGFVLKNNHYNYVPTYTAPGHASIYTGTTPKKHGIISNSWYDKFEKKSIYCVDDEQMQSVGTTRTVGEKSPARLKVTTISDQNRLATQFRGKTIGIALKDRSAILPAGHTANAAYWFSGKDEGNFISSSFYENQLPQWVNDFNASGKAKSYLKTWNTLKPIASYVESGSDENNFENGFKGKEAATFPYDLNKLKAENDGYSLLKSVPFGNDLTTDFALAAVEGEGLGQDEITDFLTISYSATDYIGHNFGVNSKEVEDAYLRLDESVGTLLDSLDAQVGKGNYTAFFTSDHGAIDVPAYLDSEKIPAGYVSNRKIRDDLKSFLGSEYGNTNFIANISNNQVFLDWEVLRKNNIDARELQDDIKRYLLSYEHIYKVYSREQLEGATYSDNFASLIQNGFNQKLSGDVVYAFDPGYISYSAKGSTHGTGLNYDTQVPLIFFGNGIQKGQTTRYTRIIDIAPTIAALLGIAMPSGTTGKVISEVLQDPSAE